MPRTSPAATAWPGSRGRYGVRKRPGLSPACLGPLLTWRSEPLELSAIFGEAKPRESSIDCLNDVWHFERRGVSRRRILSPELTHLFNRTNL